jgi:hypothetical protein
VTTFVLTTTNGRERMAAAWRFACQFLEVGKTVRVTVREAKPTRTLEQNDKFHAMCSDISRQRQWAGRWIDTEGWKRLLVDAWARVEAKEQLVVVPSLDGASVVNLGVQTHKMKVGEMADLIEFAHAWCVDNNVEIQHG